MWKVLAIALWAGVPFCWQPLWGQSPGVGVDPSHKPKQQPAFTADQTKDGQRGSKESPLIVETHERPKTDQEAAEAKREKDVADGINRWTFRFTGFNTLFTLLLVLVAFGGVWLAIRTLRVMEAQFEQWIELTNWKTQLLPDVPSHPDFLGLRPALTGRLKVQVDVVNPTGFPMMLTKGWITCGTREEIGYTMHFMAGTFLSPKSPYIVDVLIYTSEHYAKMFTEGTLMIPIEGAFWHRKKLRGTTLVKQVFRGIMECGQHVDTKVRYTIHMNPEIEKTKEGQDAAEG